MGLFSQDQAGDIGYGAGVGETGPIPVSSGFDTQGAIGAGVGAVGLGLDIFGALQGMQAAKRSAESQINIAGLESQENAQRQQAMQIVARRQQLQTVRTAQQAQAQAQAAAVGQGAQFGSGLQGGIASIKSTSAFNLQGINQQLDIGNQIFGLDKQISTQRIADYQAKSDEASASGLSAIGGSILKAAPQIASLAMFI